MGNANSVKPARASTSQSPLIEVDANDDTDPNNRVHHHARITEGKLHTVTLCGLRMKGRRRDAHELPCCPLCNMEMGALGRRCS